MMKMKGLYTALITPFDDKGNLDENGLKENLEYQLKYDVDGVVLLGTTGEAPTLTADEKERVIRKGLEVLKGKIDVFIGTGANSTAQTIENTQLAERLGADGALVVTPYYNKPTPEGLYRHFKALSESTSLPICIYNIPGRTGQNLSLDTLERIAKLPNIVGVKEASGNLVQMSEIIEKIIPNHPNFSVLSGDDVLTLPLIAMGGHGVISVIGNLLPGPLKAMLQAAFDENYSLARSLHYELTPLFRGLFIETNPIPIKAAMQICKMAAGSCRLPLCDLQYGSRETIKQLIQNLPKKWLP